MSILFAVALVGAGLWLVAEPVLAEIQNLPSSSRWPVARMFAGLVILIAGCMAWSTADAASGSVGAAHKAPPRIPASAARYRHRVVQITGEVFGVQGSPARLAAQIHQESLWRPKVSSWAGAEGMAQFMPSTGKWLAKLFPELGPYDPWDPEWALRAAATYDKYLLARADGATPCADWAFALSAYNGGETRRDRERRYAGNAGKNPDLWFDNAANYRARGKSAWRENRGYVRRILLWLEPGYIGAGWPGEAVCA